jgi:hypothetical protein
MVNHTTATQRQTGFIVEKSEHSFFIIFQNCSNLSIKTHLKKEKIANIFKIQW